MCIRDRLKEGKGDAFVSAGSTGALLSAATLMVKRIKGIRRAALAPVVPTGKGGAILIDAGATAECTPEYLLQFAFMGSYYAERILGRPEPKVGLLNIGAEPSKGTDLQREAHALLTKACLLYTSHRPPGGHRRCAPGRAGPLCRGHRQ